MVTTEQLTRPAGDGVDEAADLAALEAVAAAAESGVVAAPSWEDARRMILWLVGRLLWERELDVLRR